MQTGSGTGKTRSQTWLNRYFLAYSVCGFNVITVALTSTDYQFEQGVGFYPKRGGKAP